MSPKKGSDYSPAAHRAVQIAEQQADQLPCVCPANNLLYVFLLEVRTMRITEAQNRGQDPYSDNLNRNLKISLDNLVGHPFRVYDANSAQEVKGIGSAVANIIRDHLFSHYPQDEPDEYEQQQLDAARAGLRQAAAQKKRRNTAANAVPDLPPPQIRRTSFGHVSPTDNIAAGRTLAAAAAAPLTTTGATTATGAGRGRGRGKAKETTITATTTTTTTAPGAARLPKPKKEYTPSIGTANYAFLICLLQAQRGPENLEFLTKHDLMARAEASGLSNKPIMAEAVPQGGFRRENAQQFYSGWSSFKTIVNHGLAAEYSNPKKIKLTMEGFALAERLYRDAVDRGKVSPVAGLPCDGPLLYQIVDRQQNGAVEAAARQAQDAAGLGPGALPSAALRRSSSNATANINRTGSGTYTTSSGLGAPAAPMVRNNSLGGGGGGLSAAAMAALRRASGEGSNAYYNDFEEDMYVDDDADPLEMSLAQRLTGRGRGKGGVGAGRGEGRPPRPPPTSRPLGAAAAAGGGGGARNGIFLDLAAEDTTDEDEPADYIRISSAAGQQQQQQQQQQQERPRSRKPRVSDEHVAMMMEMGFSDKKARKALRRSLGSIEDAVEIVTVMSSAGEESSDEEEEDKEVLISAPRTAAGGSGVNINAGNINNTTNTTKRATGINRTNVAAATAAAAAAGVFLSRPLNGIAPPINNNNNNNARGHIRTGSQPTARPRLDPNSQPSQPDYLDYSQPPPQSQPQSQQQQQQQQGRVHNWWVQESEIRLPPLPPGRRFSEEYEIVLLVDGREQYSRGGAANRNDALQIHLTRMRGAGLAVEHRTLPIGDALWVARSRHNSSTEYVLDYVLERKSLTDLLSSIKDSNRYTSQKYFLNRSGLKNKYYLVEGDVETLPNPRDVKTIKTASSSTEIIDGFRVLRTKGVQETFRLYQSMTEAVVQLYSNLTSNSRNSRSSSMAINTNTPLSFDAFKEHMRQQNQGSTTVHDIWGRMLIEIPGLGPEAASVILHNYPVPKLLYEDYRKALVEGITSGTGGAVVAQGLLAGLRGENGGRSIGPDKAKKVYQALFKNRWNLQ